LHIRIDSVTSDSSTFTIVFADQLIDPSNDEYTTEIGTRAIRIFQEAFGRKTPLQILGDRTMSILTTYNYPPQTLHTALQARMNKFANVPIDVEFGPIKVTVYRYDTVLHTMEEVRNWRTKGQLIQVEQILQLSLPAAHRDLVRLRKIVPQGGVKSGSVLDKLELNFCLTEELIDQNPWDVINSLQAAIQAAIT
jgi:hypothetical protein